MIVVPTLHAPDNIEPSSLSEAELPLYPIPQPVSLCPDVVAVPVLVDETFDPAEAFRVTLLLVLRLSSTWTPNRSNDDTSSEGERSARC